ncbi:MAG TPA: hypothetical protein VJX70_07120 [Candidatus Acidoferrum sp.]|nr:hypothetical protein [Candidatus Acidoferrum sp.]
MRFAIVFLLLLSAGMRLSAQAWERLGPEGGLVVSLGADSGGAVYLGTSDGHVFVSEDRGGHWELRGRVGLRTDAVISALAGDPRVAGRIFAAAWFREAGAGGGVFRSDDAGRSWQASGLQGEAVRALEFAASQPETLVAGTRSGVFRSAVAGKSWERISPPDDPELRNVDSIAIAPGDPGVIYAGTYHLPWKTGDGGKSWKSIGTGLIDDSDIMSLRVDAANASRLYLSACSGIYRSENRGALWTKLQGIPYAARRTQAIVQDPRNPLTLYAATTEGLWVTRDAGESWQRTTPKDWVVNAVAVLPPQDGAATRVLIGTEAQGVMASEDSGLTFARANRGFTHEVVKQLAGDVRDPRHLLLLLERDGMELVESRDAGRTWSSMLTTAIGVAKNAGWSADRIVRVYSSPWGWLARMADGTLWVYAETSHAWQIWKGSYAVPARKGKTSSGVARKAAVVPGGGLVFSSENVYLAAAEGVLRCDRAGKCEPLPAFPRATRASALWVSPEGRSVSFASDGKIGISRDAGKTAVWRDLPAGITEANWILGDSRDFSRVFLGTRRGLYFSRDATEHWTLAREGLPAARIEEGLRSSDLFIVALPEGGMYASEDGMGNWNRVDEDAERGRVTGVVETQPGQFVFGSQSEGVLLWQTPKTH